MVGGMLVTESRNQCQTTNDMQNNIWLNQLSNTIKPNIIYKDNGDDQPYEHTKQDSRIT